MDVDITEQTPDLHGDYQRSDLANVRLVVRLGDDKQYKASAELFWQGYRVMHAQGS
jgi:hypothetical protein